MQLARIAWMSVTGICFFAAVILLLEGYNGYSAVVAVVGLSAAVNLFGQRA